MARYVLASLGPAALLVLACLRGGIWCYVALAAVTVLVLTLDRMNAARPEATEDAAKLRQGAVLTVVLALVHFALLSLGIAALGLVTHGWIPTLVLGLALGLYLGQVSNSNAHELIHAPDRWRRRLGTAVFVSLLFGHHASAHPRVHHVWVATSKDPNSARAGEGFYRFWRRAWIGSFREGWRAETRLRARRFAHPGWRMHPYAIYGGGALVTVTFAWWIAGTGGAAALFLLATYAQMQLLLSDYVQHYGLRRSLRENGAPEPVGPGHSWNAGQWVSAAMVLNAPRHSDHHMNPARPFPALRLAPGTMPMLPASLPVMALVALLPPVWRRMMDPRLAALQGAPASAGGVAADDLAESPHVESHADSDPADRIAAGRPIGHERRSIR